MDKWVKFCQETYGIEINQDNFEQEVVTEDEMKLFTSVNSAVLLLSKYVQMVLDRLTANANVPKDKRSIINMKNELTKLSSFI